MQPTYDETVAAAIASVLRKPIGFDVREAEGEVYVDFQTHHPGFFWWNPVDQHSSALPAFIVDGNTGEVQDGFCVKRVTSFRNSGLLPWYGVEDDGMSVQAEGYTLVCDARLLYSEEGADELQRFLQASLSEQFISC